MTDLNDAGRPAATVVIIRDRPDEAAELLMVERASTMAFAAGALVFPGGAVDPADLTLAARHGGDLALDEAAARIAAIRETIEEAGIAIGLAGPIDAAAVLRLRDGLHDGDHGHVEGRADDRGLEPAAPAGRSVRFFADASLLQCTDSGAYD